MRIRASRLCFVIDLERAAEELLVAQEFHELCIVFGSPANEIDRFSSGCAILDVLATVVKAALPFFRPQIVHFRDQKFVSLGLDLCDVDEKRLVGRTCECTERVKEVIDACGTRGDDALCELEVLFQGVDL